MEPGQPSRTAMSAAHARAVHQVADSPCVFPDPLAARIIGHPPPLPEAPAQTAASAQPGTQAGPGTTSRPETPGPPDQPGTPSGPGKAGRPGMPAEVRLFMALRHRLAEDALATAVATAGTRQAVVLGAGLDTFAYRNPHPGLRVFEVDHPDTQAWKRKRLADAGIPIPGTVEYCPVDFAAQTLDAGLAGSGFDRDAPSFFIWLGVVPYLTGDTVLATLRFVAGQDAPAEIVFDYNQPPSALPRERRAGLRAQAEAMARMGEPWRSFFTPGEIARELAGVGFGTVEDLGWHECLRRYALDESMPDLFGGRLVHAGTGPAGPLPAA